MKYITKFITILLCLQLSTNQLVAQVKTDPPDKKKNPKVFLTLLKEEVNRNASDYYDDNELSSDNNISEKIIMLSETDTISSRIKDNSYNLMEIKREIGQRLNEEEAAQLVELKHSIMKMNDLKVDEMFNLALEQGIYSREIQTDYMIAYTLKEKKAVLIRMLQSDLSHIKSMSLKRVGMMTRDELSKEVERTNLLLNHKGEKFKKIALIVLSVAAAGLATWGIIAATKKRHERKVKEYENEHARRMEQADKDFDSAMDELQKQHDDLVKDMIENHNETLDLTNQNYQNKMLELQNLFEERARLRDEGYVWDVCSTQRTEKAVTCPYDFKTYVGAEVCSQRCLRNPSTGHVHSSGQLICTSSTIPDNCYRTNPYTIGYNNGSPDGYEDGYYDGYEDYYYNSYDKAYRDYYDIGELDGRSDGYYEGFNDGYSDGLSDGEYDSARSYDEGYSAGYSDGYNYGYGG